jgi:hypothetical protein
MENTNNIKDLIQKFYPYAKNALGFEHPVRVIMRKDAENAENPLGKTAYYDPEQKLIVLYVINRHPKDVLRSFSHELVHHAQNCRGDLDDLTTAGHYAEDGKGREIEKEAYLQGNLNVRDWEDQKKFKGDNQMNEHYSIAKEEFKKIFAETVKAVLDEKKSKPDFLDLDKDGDKKEPMKKAAKDKKEKVEEKYDDDVVDAQTLAKKFKKKDKEKKKPEDDVKEASYDTMTPEEKKKAIERGERMIAAEEERLKNSLASAESDAQRALAQKIYKRNKEQSEKIIARLKGEKPEPEKKKFKPPRPSRPAYSGDTHFYGDDPRQFAPPLSEGIEESKQEEKQVVTETPQQPKEVKETNKAWYDTSLYSKLVSKWTKKGDK